MTDLKTNKCATNSELRVDLRHMKKQAVKEIIVKRPIKYNVEHREKSVRVSVQLPQSVYDKITKDKQGNEQTVREWILGVTKYKK